MPNFYVTYGFGSFQKNCYATVEANSYDEARKKVFGKIGPKFSFIYNEDEFSGQIEKYGLHEIPLMPMVMEES